MNRSNHPLRNCGQNKMESIYLNSSRFLNEIQQRAAQRCFCIDHACISLCRGVTHEDRLRINFVTQKKLQHQVYTYYRK